MANVRVFYRLAVVVLFVVFVPALARAQYVEQNVNMVAGTSYPNGDPFLQRQNEPSVAVSTVNFLHLLAVNNDYRSVDIQFDTPLGPDSEDRGDAWIGVFKSRNGGQTWWSNLLDGYPQQSTSTSPIHGFAAAADPVVRSGPHGMFYVAGLVLNRTPVQTPLSAVFLSRFIDNNNTENGDPIAHLDTKIIDTGSSGQFIDKPWIGTGPGTGTCTVSGRTFETQNVYVAYTVFVGGDNNVRTKLMFARSTDCGNTFSTQKLSEGIPINQGATVVVSPTGPIYVVWRRFKTNSDPDAIMIAKSTDKGQTFTKGAVVRTITPFEQGTTSGSIRTNAYPAATADAQGRVYIAWSDRGFSPMLDGRVMLISSPDGTTWSAPAPVDPISRGHQFMPALTSVGDKVTVVFYDLRDDSTIGVFTQPGLPKVGTYVETRQPVGDLPAHPEAVFLTFLLDQGGHRRHTLDLRAATMKTVMGPDWKYTRVSRYLFGSRPPGSTTLCTSGSPAAPCIEQLQLNPPNLPLFRLGTVPFIGDYIDIASYQTKSGASPVYHPVWTDNRDVRAPKDGNWVNYTPPASPATLGGSKFNGGPVPACVSGFTGMRNQNIYTARFTDGVFAGSPGNAKPLAPIQRAFVVFVQNAQPAAKTYRLSIVQPLGAGVTASFDQFLPVPSIDVPITAHSTATRTVFVASATDPKASVTIDVAEIAGGFPVPGGLTSSVVLNPDLSNPDLSNPDLSNPDLSNPDLSNPDLSNPDLSNNEVHNPDLSNPDLSNPDLSNPDLSNPDLSNPDLSNPDLANPDLANPDLSNPDLSNPDLSNPDLANPELSNSAVTDTTWKAHNKGNTTSGYAVKVVADPPLPPGARAQLIVHRTYQTPSASTDGGFSGCELKVQKRHQILNSIVDPHFTDAGLLSTPDPEDATVYLAPGDGVNITLRIYGKTRAEYDPSTAVSPVIIAEANNNLNGVIATSPSIASSLPLITTMTVNDAVASQPYSTQLAATGGKPPYTWSIVSPESATISPAGVFTYASGFGFNNESFTVRVTDVANKSSKKTFVPRVFSPLVITTTALPTAIRGVPYSSQLTADGGLKPYTWSDYKQSVPSWMSLNAATGALAGTPPAGFNPQQVNFQVVDSAKPNQTAVQSYQLAVADPLVITNPSLPNGIVNGAYAAQMTSTGGLGFVAWRPVGPLPRGLDMTSGGAIVGTPSLAGTFSPVVIEARDTSFPQQVVTKTFTITIDANSLNVVWTTQPVDIAGGQTATGVVTVRDSTGAVIPGANVVITIGNNPGGSTIPPNSTLTDAAGQAAVAVRNLNAGDGYTLIATVTMVGFGPASTASRSFNVSAPPLSFGNKGNLTDAFETVGYTDRLIAAGGKAPYHFKITDGALPSGMQLADDGSVTGSPTEVIFAVFTGNVTDSSVPPQSFSQQFGLQSWAQPSAFCAQGSFPIFNNWNTAAVSFNGTQPTITPKGFPNGYRLVAMATYHSSGARSGSIGLKEVVGETVTFPTTIVPSGTAGFDSWEATGIDFVLRDANGYLVNDSDPATWAQNAGSNNEGFAVLCVRPVTP